MSHPSLNELLKQADQCVKCGLCLSDCPTYQLYRNESDSPRGRITLAQTLLQQAIVIDKKTVLKHFDRCLGCGRCESVCPSLVGYQGLIDETRYRFSLSSVPKWQLAFFTKPGLLKFGIKVSGFLPEGIKAFLPGIFREASRIPLQQNPDNARDALTVTSNNNGKPLNPGSVALFTGCVGKMIDAQAINKTRLLLEKLGYRVVIPEQQSCCGAMHQHEGYIDDAEVFIETNHQVFQAFSGPEFKAVLYFASGCGAQLQQSAQMGIQIEDATEFLAKLPAIQQLSEATSSEKVAFHIPCTQLNKTRSTEAVKAIVQSIAKSNFEELADNQTCCGSAGLYQLKHPDSAEQFLKPKLNALQSSDARVLLTSNTGCALHFRQAIHNAELNIRVMHPAEWISDQYFASLSG